MKQKSTATNPSFMTKNKDLLVVGGVIVVLAGAATAYYFMTKKKEEKRSCISNCIFVWSYNSFKWFIQLSNTTVYSKFFNFI